MNNYYDLLSLWSRGTRSVHSRHNCIFNNSWAGFCKSARLNKRFPSFFFFVLQKLEEFLFGTEENHAEVGTSRMLAVRLKCRFTGTQTDQLDDLDLNMTPVALPTVWSILIYMWSRAGRLTGHFVLTFSYTQHFAEHVLSIQILLLCSREYECLQRVSLHLVAEQERPRISRKD